MTEPTVEELVERVRGEGVFAHQIAESWDELADAYVVVIGCPDGCDGCESRARRDAALSALQARVERAERERDEARSACDKWREKWLREAAALADTPKEGTHG